MNRPSSRTNDASLFGAAAAIALVAVTWAHDARAQSQAERAATAQGLYESGVELIKRGSFAAACPKLEESQRLDPSMGTQFALATCYESAGRPTSAWSLFLELAVAAKAAGNATRESTARARAAALEPRLPRLTVIVPDALAALPGLEVARDGMALGPLLWGTPVPVDLGEHKVRASAAGWVAWESSVRVTALGQRLDVTVPPLDCPADRTGDTPAASGGPAPGADGERSPQRAIGIAVGSVGLAGIVAGSVMGLLALSSWNDAEAKCPSHSACSKEAHDLSKKTLALSTGSTIAFAAGGAALAAGVIVWLTAPSRRPPPRTAIALLPILGVGAAGAALTGAF